MTPLTAIPSLWESESRRIKPCRSEGSPSRQAQLSRRGATNRLTAKKTKILQALNEVKRAEVTAVLTFMAHEDALGYNAETAERVNLEAAAAVSVAA